MLLHLDERTTSSKDDNSSRSEIWKMIDDTRSTVTPHQSKHRVSIKCPSAEQHQRKERNADIHLTSVVRSCALYHASQRNHFERPGLFGFSEGCMRAKKYGDKWPSGIGESLQSTFESR